MAGEIAVSEQMLESLRATKPWVMFLSILGFIACALMLLGALALFAGVSMMKGPMAAFGPVMGVVYLLFVLLYIFPCYFLYKYASAIGRIPAVGGAAMEEALSRQKSFWRYMGILMAVILALELIFIVFGVFLGALFGMRGHS